MASRHGRAQRQARHERVKRVANILRRGEPTSFALQGATTAALRSALCLKGWPYALAHDEADKTVKAALDMIGAKRPAWHQGQPDYVHPELIERVRCARCRRPLPEDRRLWCSDTCAQAAHNAKHRHFQGEAAAAARAAVELVWERRWSNIR